jgi:periplasmic protein CpxP/Spy
MKQHILTVTAAALLSIPTFSVAQDKPAGDKPAGERPEGGRRAAFNPEERLKNMTEKLSLTQEQQDKIKAIFAKSADANKALREKGFQNLSEEERKQMNEARKAQQEEIVALLTPEQKEKYKEMATQGRRRGEGGARPDADKPKQ